MLSICGLKTLQTPIREHAIAEAPRAYTGSFSHEYMKNEKIPQSFLNIKLNSPPAKLPDPDKRHKNLEDALKRMRRTKKWMRLRRIQSTDREMGYEYIYTYYEFDTVYYKQMYICTRGKGVLEIQSGYHSNCRGELIDFIPLGSRSSCIFMFRAAQNIQQVVSIFEVPAGQPQSAICICFPLA